MSKQSSALLEMGYIQKALAPDTQVLGNLQFFQVIYYKVANDQLCFTFASAFCCQQNKTDA